MNAFESGAFSSGAFDAAGTTITRRAIVIIGGKLYQIKDEWLGMGAPYLVLSNGRLVEDYTRAGKPLVLVNGVVRTLATGETILI